LFTFKIDMQPWPNFRFQVDGHRYHGYNMISWIISSFVTSLGAYGIRHDQYWCRQVANGAFQKFSRQSEGSESPLPQPSFCQVKDLSGKGEVPWGEVLQACGVDPPVIRVILKGMICVPDV
jgi:hypothetical protein